MKRLLLGLNPLTVEWTSEKPSVVSWYVLLKRYWVIYVVNVTTLYEYAN